MEVKYKICDMCKKQITAIQNWREWTLSFFLPTLFKLYARLTGHPSMFIIRNRSFDLCGPCAVKVIDYIKNGGDKPEIIGEEVQNG